MAFDTYANFRTAVKTWLGRGSDTTHFTDANVADMVTLAESEIYRRLRVREMETSANLTVNAQSVALPTSYIGMRRIYLDTATEDFLKFVTPEVFWTTWASATSGTPEVFTIEGGNILFGPSPNTSYTGKILYYKKLTTISSTLNDLFTNSPDLFFYGTLAQAVFFGHDDERLPVIRAAFESILGTISAQDRKDRFSGGVLERRPQVVV
jgi:hypothetical protein